MPTNRRKIEVYCLKVSGLSDGTAYGSFLRRLRGGRPVAEMVIRAGDKSHALNEARVRNHRLRLRFFSYTKGHRPDVLDTNDFQLSANPLSQNQTNVEWTHALGSRKGDRYILLIERNYHGIWPTAIERYLQWMIDEFHEAADVEEENAEQEPITLSLEAEPGDEFLERMDALDQITEAKIRIVRPNPGWRDLQNDLGENAGESDARKVDITMTARRRGSLNRERGIVRWIRAAFSKQELDFAAVKGRRAGQVEFFDTTKLGKHVFAEFETDEQGQVIPENAWSTLSGIMDDLE